MDWDRNNTLHLQPKNPINVVVEIKSDDKHAVIVVSQYWKRNNKRITKYLDWGDGEGSFIVNDVTEDELNELRNDTRVNNVIVCDVKEPVKITRLYDIPLV